MSDEDELDNNRTDQMVSLAKGVVGIIPYAGPILAEIIGSFIPRQRVDRLASFIKKLEKRLDRLDQSTLREKMATPEFIDLFEDGAIQASRALTDERREQIAAILANGLTEEDLHYEKAKLLLNLLGELNDIEIIFLIFYSLAGNPPEQQKLAKTHQNIFSASDVGFDSSQEERDDSAIIKANKEHLVRLGLLKYRFPRLKKGEIPEFDDDTGMMKTKGYSITPLGRLLVRWIE